MSPLLQTRQSALPFWRPSVLWANFTASSVSVFGSNFLGDLREAYVMQLHFISVYVGSAIWRLLFHLVYPFRRWFSPRICAFLERPLRPVQLDALAEKRKEYTHCVLFYCSSAGEYEQALPILHRLPPWVFGVVIFFSASGTRYLQNRQDSTPYLLAPPVDTIGVWIPIFAALRPSYSVVVRHELWPAFLFVARKYGRTSLINGSLREAVRRSFFHKKWKRALLEQMDLIYTVDDTEKTHFRHALGLPTSKISPLVGDTKFDRVFERAQATSPSDLAALRSQYLPNRFTCILGSAWEADIEIALESQAQLLRRKGPTACYLVVVLHEPSEEKLSWVERQAKQKGLRTVRYSHIETPQEESEILLIDRMGILAELYQIGDCALVGGAFHHQVHNVLEPGCRGLAVAFGPRYENSHEACKLVRMGLATVCHNHVELMQWLQNAEVLQKKGKDTKAFLHLQQGIAEKITKELMAQI
jgi:3-deoxy-D-manno-octulosonic-acid transferase